LEHKAEADYLLILIVSISLGLSSVILIPESSSFIFMRVIFSGFLLLFLPGYSVLDLLSLGKKLKGIELIILSVVLSIAIATLTSAYLAFLPIGINNVSSILGVCSIVIVVNCIKIARRVGPSPLHLAERKEIFFVLIAMVIGFIFPFVHIMESSIFFSRDPYANYCSIMDILLHNYTTDSLLSNLNGLNFFGAMVSATVGFSPFYFVRLGGMFFLMLLSASIFILAKRFNEDYTFGILASFFVVTAPYLTYRFNMTLSENLAIIFLILLIFLLLLVEKGTLSFIQVIVPMALIFGAYITLHYSWMFFFIFLTYIFIFKFKDRKINYCKWLIFMVLLALGLGSFALILNIYTLYWLLFIGKGSASLPTKVLYEPLAIEKLLDNLSLTQFILAPIGLVLMLVEWRKHKIILQWFIPLLFFFTFLTQIARFGLNWPGWRFVIYISIFIAFFSSYALTFIKMVIQHRYLINYSHQSKLIHLKSKPKVLRTPSSKDLKQVFLIFQILLMVSPVIYYNALHAYERHGWKAWDENDIEALNWLKQYQIQRNVSGIIVSYTSYYFLKFFKYNFGGINYEENITFIRNVIEAQSFESRLNLLQTRYTKKFKDIYFYITHWALKIYKERYRNFYDHLNLMKNVFDKDEIKIYRISISNLTVYPRVALLLSHSYELPYIGMMTTQRIFSYLWFYGIPVYIVGPNVALEELRNYDVVISVGREATPTSTIVAWNTRELDNRTINVLSKYVSEGGVLIGIDQQAISLGNTYLYPPELWGINTVNSFILNVSSSSFVISINRDHPLGYGVPDFSAENVAVPDGKYKSSILVYYGDLLDSTSEIAVIKNSTMSFPFMIAHKYGKGVVITFTIGSGLLHTLAYYDNNYQDQLFLNSIIKSISLRNSDT